MLLPLAFLDIGVGEMALLAIVALLLYGSDLPEAARTWGKTYQEFRRNMNGFRSELNNVIYSEPEKDAPRKLQYYPEFHNDAADSDAAEENDDSTDAVAATAAEPSAPSVPIATTPATGTTLAASDESERKDAHGAA